MLRDLSVDLERLRMRMTILAVHPGADQDGMGRDVEQRCRVRGVPGAMMGCSHDVGLERAAEEPVDGLPSGIFRVVIQMRAVRRSELMIPT